MDTGGCKDNCKKECSKKDFVEKTTENIFNDGGCKSSLTKDKSTSSCGSGETSCCQKDVSEKPEKSPCETSCCNKETPQKSSCGKSESSCCKDTPVTNVEKPSCNDSNDKEPLQKASCGKGETSCCKKDMPEQTSCEKGETSCCNKEPFQKASCNGNNNNKNNNSNRCCAEGKAAMPSSSSSSEKTGCEGSDKTATPIKKPCCSNETSSCQKKDDAPRMEATTCKPLATKKPFLTVCCDMCRKGSCCRQNCCIDFCCIQRSTLPAHADEESSPLSPSSHHGVRPSFFFTRFCWGIFGGYGRRRYRYNAEEKAVLLQETPREFGSVMHHSASISKVRLLVGGMTCTDCASTIEDKLKEQNGVVAINLGVMTGTAEITHDSAQIAIITIIQIIETLGFTAAVAPDTKLSTIEFSITPTMTSSQSQSIITELKSRNGVVSADICLEQKPSASSEYVRISYDSNVVGARDLKDFLTSKHCNNGFSLRVASTTEKQATATANESQRYMWYFWVSVLFAIPVFIISFVLPSFPVAHHAMQKQIVAGFPVQVLVNWILTTPIQFFVGYPLYVSTFRALVYSKKPNMDTLVMLSTTTAYFYSFVNMIIGIHNKAPTKNTFFETSAILLTLIMLGRYLESLAKKKTSGLLHNLYSMQAPTAILCGTTATPDVEIEPELIQKNDILKVLAGAVVPTDGVVVSGCTSIDESMVTGESMPVFKKINDVVYGGTVNQQGAIQMRATNLVGDNMLHKIAQLVLEAQSSKPPIQLLADNVASYFVPFVIVLSVVVFVFWYLLASHKVVHPSMDPLPFALQFCLTVLVISCPCAIGLAVPTAIAVGTSVAAKKGILFKNGGAIESCSKITTIAFDKTGTLTMGKPTVVCFHVFDSLINPKTFYSLVGSAESMSEHVIGKAIYAFCQRQFQSHDDDEFEQPSHFTAVSGKGLKCAVKEVGILMGNRTWLEENNIVIERTDAIVAEFESRSCTLIYVAVDGKFVGMIGLSDTVKPDAQRVVQHLQEQYQLDVWVISGDNPAATAAIASSLGIPPSNTLSGMTPQNKISKIQEFQREGKVVAMVGDGINDSPALVQANVGIAVGSGTDVAIEAADIVLVKDSLDDVLMSIELSKAILSKIKFNFFWAFLYNITAIPLAAGVFWAAGNIAIPPAFAGISELLSSVPVIMSSLALTFFKPAKKNNHLQKE